MYLIQWTSLVIFKFKSYSSLFLIISCYSVHTNFHEISKFWKQAHLVSLVSALVRTTITYFLLTQLLYVSVTTCCLATEALKKLRERKDAYDIVISDVNMPDMDGFKLLEQVGLEMDLPVISQFSLNFLR